MAVVALGACAERERTGTAKSLPTHRLEVGTSLGPLFGRIVSDDDFVVVPNRAWQVRRDSEQWLFVGAAAMICHVEHRPELPLVLGFIPDAETLAKPLRIFWNQQDVTHLLRRAHERELQAEIPPEWLEPGTHHLGLAVEGGPDERAVFDAIGFRYRNVATILRPARLLKFRYLGDLFSSGVTGSYARENMGGLVFDGPRELRLVLESDGTSRGPEAFVARVQNSSYGPATFRATAGGQSVKLELEVHERESLRLPLPAGADEIRLRVEGDPNGLFLWGAPGLVRPADPRPPLVLVTLDTTRRDALAPYGGAPELTPELSRFAETATVYTRAWATSPWTLPSHASIFTGLYPSRHGAGVRSDHLAPTFETLAERLRDEGYLTAGFAGGALCSFRFGVAQGFGVYVDPDGFETRGDTLTEEVADFLRDYRRHFDGQPLLLFVNYFDPHYPYEEPHPSLSASARHRLGRIDREDELPAPWPAVLGGDGGAWQSVIAGEAPGTRAVDDALRRRYLAEVAFADRQVGRLVDLLEDTGLFDQALVVVTADHGELLGEGGYYSHTSRLDPELLAIPLLVKWPGQRTGQRADAPVSLVDLFPTLLRAGRGGEEAGDGLVLTPRDAEGRDLLERREAVYGEEHEAPSHTLFANMRHGEHAWARIAGDVLQLVWQGSEEERRCRDLTAPPWAPVPCDPSVPAADELRARLGYVDDPGAHGKISLSAEERRALSNLGYLD
jgi:arylsulfatase A-like enzyme